MATPPHSYGVKLVVSRESKFSKSSQLLLARRSHSFEFTSCAPADPPLPLLPLLRAQMTCARVESCYHHSNSSLRMCNGVRRCNFRPVAKRLPRLQQRTGTPPSICATGILSLTLCTLMLPNMFHQHCIVRPVGRESGAAPVFLSASAPSSTPMPQPL